MARRRSAVRVAGRHAIRWITGGPAQRRVLWREYVFRVLRHFTQSIAVEASDGMRYFISTTDLAIGRTVFATGECGGQDLALAVELTALHQHTAPETFGSKVFVDVGANIGTTALRAVASHGFARAVAIEPEGQNAKLLQVNAVTNDLADRVSVVRAAASAIEGTTMMELSPRNSGDHRIRARPMSDGAFQEAQRETTTVRSHPLDAILATEAVSPSHVGMVWIDVQGHEAQVLAGARCILEAGVPMVLEYWPYGLQRAGNVTDVPALLSKFYTSYIDLGDSSTGRKCSGELLPIASLPELVNSLRGIEHTNLLLLRAPVTHEGSKEYGGHS